jgi:hopene-associated glycosyltransferase HpnB
VLVFALGGFWLARERDGTAIAALDRWPAVVAIVPARDEAEVIERAVAGLAAQDYPGAFRIVLVDDGSSDGTAALAHKAGGEHLSVLTAAPLATGWTGKLAAVSQGIASAGEPVYLWLTDADIAHAPDTLRSLVARAERGKLALVSLMARLRCRSLAERALVPAFVFFFQMLYPFARVNRPGGTAAAAGGCMLVNCEALARAGGIAAIRDALIDDCALAALMKRQGPIWLGLTDRSLSIRRYDNWGSVADMIARSAYAQLGYNPLALFGTVVGMALVYLAPPFLALAGHGAARWLGLAAWALMALSFQPVLRFYRRSPLWGIMLPLIAAFYAGCTLLSAWRHWRGRGGMWKGRAQAVGR